MASETENITEITRGNDITLNFTVTSTETVERAMFTVKKKERAADSTAIITKDVTSVLSADGQITGAGPYVVTLFLTQDDTSAGEAADPVKAGTEYKWDLEVFNGDDQATTPVGGVVIFKERVRLAVGV